MRIGNQDFSSGRSFEDCLIKNLPRNVVGKV